MASTLRNGAFSPPLSSATSQYTTGVQSRLNIVSRLAIEGKARQEADEAIMKLYLKLNIPMDSVIPGQTIPLFKEDDVKIREFQVHPLDANSVPFSFSSATHPLLHSAAHALNLPARSTKSYVSLFENASGHSSSSSGYNSAMNGSVITPMENRYTGYILVCQYNVCYIVPKEFPPKYKLSATTDSDGEGIASRSGSKIPFKSRRGSMGERNNLQFMVAIELLVPYSTKPPKAPYLLSIPIPRCLSNTAKVRIFQPKAMTTSFQSLSSDEEISGWEVATEPAVTKTSSKLSRSSTYMNFADDESSEASMAGTSDNCIIQGTFTSSDYLRIRWATPLRNQVDAPADGRRRVGIVHAQGNLTCTILEKTDGGVKIRLDYQGTCTGVWSPGVATMLGMDVTLDRRGSHCSWPEDSPGRWSIDGDVALTDFTVGSPMNPSLSRDSSLETPQMTLTGLPQGFDPNKGSPTPSRASSMSSSSLLRAPLPHRESTPEYSFEDSSQPTTPGLQASIAYTHSSVGEFGLSGGAGNLLSSPTEQITLHLNMNELQHFPKNSFVFNISGTLVVSPSLAESDVMTDPDTVPISLPSFVVLRADTQETTITVRNLCEDFNVDVFPGTSISQAKVGKKTLLQSGSHVKYDQDGAMILVKPGSPKLTPNHLSRTISQAPRTPMSVSTVAAMETSMSFDRSLRPTIYRDGPLVIPWTTISIIPHPSTSRDSWSYTLRLILPVPVDAPSEWLEFGLSMPPPRYKRVTAASVSMRDPPKVNIACASVNGVPTRFESFEHLRPKLEPFERVKEEDDKEKRQWLTWIRVYCGPGRQGELRIDCSLAGKVYDVLDEEVAGKVKEIEKGKGIGQKEKDGEDEVDVNVFLPMFSLPVASYDIALKRNDIIPSSETVMPQLIQDERQFHRLDVQPFTYQHVLMRYHLSSKSGHARTSIINKLASQTLSLIWTLAPIAAVFFLIIQITHLRLAHQRMEYQLADLLRGRSETVLSDAPGATSVLPGLGTNVKLTSTDVTSTTQERWWYGGGGGLTHTIVVPSASSSGVQKSQPVSSGPRPTFPSLSRPQSSLPSMPLVPETSAEDKENEGELPPSVVPMLYVPISWVLQQRVYLDQMKQQVISGWAKVWRIIDIVVNWPLPVAPTEG